MKLLVRPEPFGNESLESYLLRLSSDNFYTNYQEFSHIIWCYLKESDYEAAGAFPRELALVNIYHASRTSSFRVRAIQLLESLTEVGRLPLLAKAVLNSNMQFLRGLSSVSCNGVVIPQCFLRSFAIPVCPECLKEFSYIRQYWHLLPYTVCHHHECELLTHCPDCQVELNYLETENITHCRCGFDLRSAVTVRAGEVALKLSALLIEDGTLYDENDCLQALDLSHRYGAFTWYYLRHHDNITQFTSSIAKLEGAIDYFGNWPQNYYPALDEMVKDAELKQVKKFNKTSFNSIFGNLLLDCRQLPSRDTNRNFILRDTINYFDALVQLYPKSKHANIADTLLTILEVATLLSTTHDQIYRLYQDGYLIIATKLKQKERLGLHQPAFFLRQVMELRSSRIVTNTIFSDYLPAW
ncbi:MAG: putative DNA-binding transcriptional regulator AlpA [Cocleimonas sp.]|jgi:predicted DNA-binding transcriptional regulator AlpA